MASELLFQVSRPISNTPKQYSMKYSDVFWFFSSELAAQRSVRDNVQQEGSILGTCQIQVVHISWWTGPVRGRPDSIQEVRPICYKVSNACSIIRSETCTQNLLLFEVRLYPLMTSDGTSNRSCHVAQLMLSALACRPSYLLFPILVFIQKDL